MNEEEAIGNLKNYIECLMEDYGYYKDIVEFRDSVEHLEKSLQTQQAEIEKKDKMTNEMSENVEKAIEYMEHYIKSEPNNENVKCEFREVIEILKGK